MRTAEIKVDYVGHFGNDETIVNAARVSFEKEAANYTKEENDKLIRYLARHKHFSPFNHAFLSFRIKAPIFVSRQLVKHKFMPWNEVSRRYVSSEPEFFFPDGWREKAENVKQGSNEDNLWYIDHISSQVESCLIKYNQMIEMGVCPEMARMVLPQNMMTEWIWSGTLGAFLDMLVLRLDPHTQYESRVVAQYIAEHIKELFPISYKARIEQ